MKFFVKTLSLFIPCRYRMVFTKIFSMSRLSKISLIPLATHLQNLKTSLSRLLQFSKSLGFSKEEIKCQRNELRSNDLFHTRVVACPRPLQQSTLLRREYDRRFTRGHNSSLLIKPFTDNLWNFFCRSPTVVKIEERFMTSMLETWELGTPLLDTSSCVELAFHERQREGLFFSSLTF